MQKTVLVTGATDGIGLETAKMLFQAGHTVLLHGRNPNKLKALEKQLDTLSSEGAEGKYDAFVADFSVLQDVEKLAKEVQTRYSTIDVLINNAGILRVADSRTSLGVDVRFVVNTIAPYLLTKKLLPLIPKNGRVVNLSSAAQAPVEIPALLGKLTLDERHAYAESKLALTMWSRQLGLAYKNDGPVIVSVNPKSLLGSNMVKEAYGIEGDDVSLGADILYRATLSDEFSDAHGAYFDNDAERFADPHKDALDPQKVSAVVDAIESLINL